MKEIAGVKLYSTKELAKLIEVSYPTAQKMLRRGDLACTKIGTGNYVSEESLIEFLRGTKRDNSENKD